MEDSRRGVGADGAGTRVGVRGRWVWTLLAGLLLLAGAVVLVTASGDVRRESALAGSVPVRVVSPPDDARAPALVLSHGFAGSAAMMDPMASALARAGYVVLLPDLPGHGSNADPLAEGVLEPAVGAAVALAAERTGGAVAVAGHSMGAGAVTAWAAGEGSATTAATIAISLPSAEDLPADPARPPNLLLLWGSAEQQRFVDAALDALALGHPDALPGATYGSAADGTARRAVEIAGAEHIAVVYRDQSAREIAAWLGGGSPRGDARWIGLVLVLVGGVVLARPLLVDPVAGAAGSAGRVGEGAGGAGPWRAVGWLGACTALAGLGAALLQGILEAVPVAVAGYLIGWFACGALVLVVAAGRVGSPAGTRLGLARGALAGAALAASLALPARLTWAEFALVGPRPWVLSLLLGVLGAWFWGEAGMLHGIDRWRRAAVLACSRVLVVAGLLAAVVLLDAPGFLTLTVPLVIPILGLLAVIAWWARDPAAAASAQAIPLALAIAATFPIVA